VKQCYASNVVNPVDPYFLKANKLINLENIWYLFDVCTLTYLFLIKTNNRN